MALAKEKISDKIIMVDNCYGEFVNMDEPVAVGADVMAGSLIKNQAVVSRRQEDTLQENPA